MLISERGSALGRVTPSGRVRLVRGDRDVFGLRGRSAEQRVALDLLLDESVGIVSLGGKAGTGKSALALCAGLEAVLERRTQRKVVVFRPLYAVGGQELGYLPGNIELIPDAEVDDGRLDVVRLQPRNFFGWLMIWRKVAWENRVLRKSALGRQLIDLTGGDKRREIVYASGRSVDIVIEGDPEEFEIDGEEFGEITAARFVVDPGAFIVRVAPS